MKRWSIIVITAILLTFMFGQVHKARFLDAGIASLETYEDIQQLDAKMNYIFGDSTENEDEIYNSFIQYEDDYVNDMDKAPIILVGTATGSYSQNGQSFGQEIKVNNVIKGSSIANDEVIFVYNTDGFNADSKGNVMYTNIQNVMLEGLDYLIFLKPLALNDYTKTKGYVFEGSYFSYLCLSDRESYAITQPLEELRFNDLEELEYFSSSDRILEQIQIIKHRIVDNYLE